MVVFYCLLFVCVLAVATEGTDPCIDNTAIPNLGHRYINNQIDEHAMAIHDDRLPEGWYRVGNDTMPEHAPNYIFTCGTKFPIWLRGSHPKGSTAVNRTACQLRLTNDCEITYDIKIQNCGTYYVYFLKQTNSSTSGYCFGEGTPVTQRVDPCKDNRAIPNLGHRYINYQIDEHDMAIHDDRLPVGWYRVGNDTMPEHAPNHIFSCGTKFPIWLRGSHPNGTTTAKRTACQLSLANDCEITYYITIQNCGTYYVYFLKQTTSSTSGYCFGEGTTGIRSRYIVSKPRVEHRVKKTFVRHRPVTEVMFFCNATPSATDDLYYMVSWYGDGNLLYNTHVVKPIDSEQLQMDETTFVTHNFKMGQDITCAVTPFTQPNGPPGKLSAKADAKFIGIKILTPSLSFQSGERDPRKKTIRLQPTVPIGCAGTDHCMVQITTFLPAKTPDRMCTQSLGFSYSTCGVNLYSSNYSSVVELEVEDIDYGTYSQGDGTYDIFLRTENTNENKIWQQYLLPRITVQIKPNPTRIYQEKSCTSHNALHINTFDGRSYDNQHAGVFTLYKHVSYDAEIQIRYYQCGTRSVGGRSMPIMCNCGVAVRAGVTLYVIGLCDTPLTFGFKSCGDDALTVKYQGQKKFTLTFIYGTYVVVTVDSWTGFPAYVLSVEVFPSSHDLNATRGLCGILDANCRNDFHDRRGLSSDPALQNGACSRFTNAQWSYEHQPNTFIEIWKVTHEVNLFDDTIGPNNFTPFDQYMACVCRVPHISTIARIYNKIPCIKDTVAQCQPGHAIKGTHTCAPAVRSKRSVHWNPIIPTVRLDDVKDREKDQEGGKFEDLESPAI